MTPLALNTAAAVGMLRRDALAFFSYKTQVVSVVASNLVGLTSFFYLSKLISFKGFETPGQYFAFVSVGLVVLSVIQSSLSISDGIRAELIAGTLERLVVSPFGLLAGILSTILFPLAVALFEAIVTFIFAIAIFGVHLEATAPLAIPLLLLATAAFASIGLMLSAGVLVFKQGVIGEQWIPSAIALTSGIYYPVSVLPGWIQWTSQVQPFTPAVDLSRHLLVGTPLEGSVLGTLAKLTGFTIVFFPIAIVILRAGVHRGRATGRIIEY